MSDPKVETVKIPMSPELRRLGVLYRKRLAQLPPEERARVMAAVERDTRRLMFGE